MSQFLGKEDFRYGLTTKDRGTFGNNPVLNVCHGYDPTSGTLVPIHSVKADAEIGYGNINYVPSAKDFAIEHRGQFYTFGDIMGASVGNTTLSAFYGAMSLYSRPVVSNQQIVYPTSKGLFIYEPGAASGKQRVRPLSIMSPMDFDAQIYSIHNEENNRPRISQESVTRTRAFVASSSASGGAYTVSQTGGSDDCVVAPIKCCEYSPSNDGIEITATKINQGFSARTAFAISDYVSTKPLWFVYDIKIENDRQEYALATMFENKDVTHGGYEIAFLDTNGNDLAVIGVPRCVPVKDTWYRCASCVDFGENDPEDTASIEFRCASYWENKNATLTKVKIGCMAFEPSFMNDANSPLRDCRHQWRYIGNFLYNEEAREHSEYSDVFKRDEDNENEQPNEENLIKNADLDSFPNGWETTTSGDFESFQNYDLSGQVDVYPMYDNTKRLVTVDGHTFTNRAGANGDKDHIVICSAKQLVAVEPFCKYSGYVRVVVWGGNTNKFGYCSLSLSPESSKQSEIQEDKFTGPKEGATLYSNVWYVKHLKVENYFTGNNSTLWFTIGTKADECTFLCPILKLVEGHGFYATSRIMYSYTAEDMFNAKKNSPHTCNRYSYSFLCRDIIGASWSAVGTKNDTARMAISNPSDDSVTVADDPFAATTVTTARSKTVDEVTVTYRLPRKTINSVDRDAIDIYGDYFRYVCFYRSTITGIGTIGQYMFRKAESAVGSDGGFSFVDDLDDTDTDFYKIEENWYIDPVQPVSNDYLHGAKFVVNLNKRLYCGYLLDANGNQQPLSLAVSTKGSNWAFPATVDDTSDYLTGTQLDNLQSVSTEITGLGVVGDVLLVFYDKEVIRLYGNDFYSSNGFNTTALCRLRNKNIFAVANTLSELIFTDGFDMYLTNGNNLQNISKRAIEVSNIGLEYSDTVTGVFNDNHYYLLNNENIYAFSLERGCWYSFDKANIVQLIEAYDRVYCVVKDTVNNADVYSIHRLFGTEYSGTKIIETFYQIIGDTQADRRVNSFAFEGSSPVDNLDVGLDVFTQSQNDEHIYKDFKMYSYKTRYNNHTKFNYSAVAVKNRITYTGTTPPTFYSLGEIRINDEQVR